MRYRNLFALLLVMAWLYGANLKRLFLQWVGPHSDPNFAHGIFVPLFVLYVLWQERREWERIPAAPSWSGFPLIVVSLMLLVLGDLGSDIFLPRVSLLLMLAGLTLFFLGWKFFRAVLFPWACLILMVPIPALILEHVTFPLQQLAAKLSTGLLEFAGVPVLREGNILSLAAMKLDVAEACSGIRSLLTLVTLAIIYGYLMETRKWVRVVLVCAALPIAVGANSLRIFVTGELAQHGHRDWAEGIIHESSGIVIFAVALIMLIALHRVILLIWKSGSAAQTIGHPQELDGAEVRVPASASRFGLVIVVMLATAIGLAVFWKTESIPQHYPPSSVPLQIGDWSATEEFLSEDELELLGHPEYVVRDYVNAGHPQPFINLYIAFYKSQSAGDTIHSPEHCLPGSGWKPTRREVVELPRPDGSFMRVNRYVVAQSGNRLLVLFWFQAHDRVVASAWRAKYYLAHDSIQMHRSDGALVRLFTPMFDGESPEAAQARVMQLGSQVLPMLEPVIPR